MSSIFGSTTCSNEMQNEWLLAWDCDVRRPRECNSMYAKIQVEDDKGVKIAEVRCKEIAASLRLRTL